jgi:hypothetical protein
MPPNENARLAPGVVTFLKGSSDTASQAAEDERKEEQDDEDEEEDFGDPDRSAGDAPEAQRTGDKCDNQKNECVVKHGISPLMNWEKNVERVILFPPTHQFEFCPKKCILAGTFGMAGRFASK